jgi:glycosyltransferase involved in cell wall biosynthesis
MNRSSTADRPQAEVAVIILTLNEEPNLPYALRSVCGWAKEVHVVDSGSTDQTRDIARRFGCNLVYHRFEDYSRQRNYALEKLPLTAEWILFLDADEWLTEKLKQEIADVLATRPAVNGYYLRRRLIWMGHRIRWGGYDSTWLLRLLRRGSGRCEERPINEHLLVEGRTGCLQHDLIHQDRKGLSDWTAKHNVYATLEALQLATSCERSENLAVNLWGSAPERKRWLRQKVWNRLPLFLRPWLFFAYRYFLCLGFLNRCFLFHFLQELWLHMLIDAKLVELRQSRHPGQDTIPLPAAASGKQRRTG